ncbi:MAG: PTS sugar transporter subunit IIC [Syntrophales bacterium]
MTTQIILLSLLGGFLSLDRVWGQFMISRPVVTAPLVGIVLGDAFTGLQVGALLELFWIDRLPIGTCLPPNDFLVAFLVTAASILAGHSLGSVSQELLALASLLFIPCGYLGQKLDQLIIQSNDRIYDSILHDAKQGELDGISLKFLTGLVKHFLAHACLIPLLLFSGVALLVYIFPLLTAPCLQALRLTFIGLPLLGIAAALNTISLKRVIPIFCALFLLLTLIWEGLHAF